MAPSRRGEGRRRTVARPDTSHPAAAPSTQDDGSDHRQPALPFPVVCIGASAGGLEAFNQLLGALATDTGMAFVLVTHLSPSHASHLAEILSRATRMPVTEVKGDQHVQPNCVYVIPPDSSMILSQGSLKLLPRHTGDGRHHPIDMFLASLARAQGHKAIAIILSGTGSDGTQGMDEIKAAGGITFAQDESAAYEGMPRSAVMAGTVDFRLAPAAIARELVKIARHAYVGSVDAPERIIDGGKTATILQQLQKTMGVDFTHYKSSTLQRRIARRMALNKLEKVGDYTEFLRTHPAELDALFQDILINVTSFFRDPETFDLLKSSVLPRIVADRSASDAVRMWVVGCSTGEEAYSLAIVFAEFLEQQGRAWPVQIFATDLNGAAVERARSGVYPKSIAERVSAERLRRYFYELDGTYRVAKEIRDMCVFAKHNVLGDPPFSRMDLISCRNLLIYLEPVLQQHLIPTLHYALKPAGLLVLGGSESTGAFAEQFEPVDAKHRIYEKRPSAVRLPAPLLPRSLIDRPLPDDAAAARELRRTEGAPREAERILLERYTPPGVVVTEELDILQFHGDTSAYLAPLSGKASLNLVKMAREGLLAPIRAAIARAKAESSPFRTGDIEVIPMKGTTAGKHSFLVLFHAHPAAPTTRAPKAAVNRAVALEMHDLKAELTATKDHLQSVIEQQEAANEELQSANEEVQSANEELQSINEEIETSKEEMESSNEELATVNEQLQNRNAELGRSNNDLLNLLTSVQVAIVMLSTDLKIRRFTPMAQSMLNLIPTDVGRPLTDIKLNVDVPDLETILRDVIETMQPFQRDVRDRNGRWFSLRVRPYRTSEARIEGAVIALIDVDGIKQTAESLRVGAERLRIMYDRAPVGIFETNLDGKFERVNDRFCELTGRSRDALLTLRSEDITHPDDLALQREDSERLSAGDVTSVHREKRYLRENGQAVWVELHRFVVPDSEGRAAFTVGIAEDIGERKETETQLRRREARFRALMNSAPVLIWASGLEGMEYVNQAYLEFLGVESHDVLGNAWTYYLHPEDREGYATIYEQSVGGLQPFEYQFRFRRSDGDYRWMMAVALPQFGPAGKFAGYTGAFFDITALKQAESSLRTADQRKDEFIAMLAHELRNPLAPITNIVQMMRAHDLDEKTLGWAHEVLDRQLGNVGRMVNDLLDVSRVSHGKIELHRQRIELGELVSRSVDALRATVAAAEKEIAIELPTTPVVLFADPVRLEQVIGNLISNAVKFTPHDGHIWVSAALTNGDTEVQISVKDDGDGIAADALPHVFDLFMQGTTSFDRAQGGLGIGLSLVRGLVELHGGSIEANSDGPGTGSEFIVRLPLPLADAPALQPHEPPPAREDNGEKSGPKRILIVDDNTDAATALAALIRKDDHTVEIAHSGTIGLETARTFRPDVALVDLGMPGMNGFEVAERLRASHQDLLIIAVSGYSGEENRRRAKAAKFDEYVVKPLDARGLRALLNRRTR